MRATFHLFPLTSWSHAKELFFFSPRMKLLVIKGTRLTISRGLARGGGGGDVGVFFSSAERDVTLVFGAVIKWTLMSTNAEKQMCST